MADLHVDLLGVLEKALNSENEPLRPNDTEAHLPLLPSDDSAPPPPPEALSFGKEAPAPPDELPWEPCKCHRCGMSLAIPESPALRCGLCLTCRFATGDPFQPGKLLTWGWLKSGQTKVLNVSFASFIDEASRSLPYGHRLEVRCLRVDAPEWRYELTHCWPSGISLFVDDQRVMKKVPDEEHDQSPGPFDFSSWVLQNPRQVYSASSIQVSAATSTKKSEQWALGILLVKPVVETDMLLRQVADVQAPLQERMRQGLEKVKTWVSMHRPDRVSKKDQLRCVEPPILKLTDCTSLMRIETAARGGSCEHLQCFDLRSYLHTMRNIPPKHAWCCPVCDKPAPMHHLRLDAFAQSVIDKSAQNVVEVLVADDGKWIVSATEEPLEDDSSEEAVSPAVLPRTMADLQQAALNLGRPTFVAHTAPKLKGPGQSVKKMARNSGQDDIERRRDRSRSPKCAGQKGQIQRSESNGFQKSKMAAWRELQGIHDQHETVPENAMLGVKDTEEAAQAIDGPCRKSTDLSHQLPEGWIMRTSRRTGQVYFVNEKLQKSQFEWPTEAQAPQANEEVGSDQDDDFDAALDAQLAAVVMPQALPETHSTVGDGENHRSLASAGAPEFVPDVQLGEKAAEPTIHEAAPKPDAMVVEQGKHCSLPNGGDDEGGDDEDCDGVWL